MNTPNERQSSQSRIARRYDRIASAYDWFEAPMDMMGGRRRRARVVGSASGKTLEIGIGTGRNLSLYPRNVELSGIDISERMLSRAGKRASQLGINVGLDHGDVEHLPFADDEFETVIATCVFCSVDDPVRGLREVERIVKPAGQVLLLEYVRPRGRVSGWLADRLTSFTRRLLGPDINRQSEDNVRLAGLEMVDVKRQGVWREILARPEKRVIRLSCG